MLREFVREFKRHKEIADKALAALSDEAFFKRPGEKVNPPALIVKHLAGNLTSRWTDFLTSDGEKPTRMRDQEFVLEAGDTRTHLMTLWKRGWDTLFATLATLSEVDFADSVTIRGESFTVFQALLRNVDHATYHIGQLTYLTRLLQPDAPWLTIPPGGSQSAPGNYLKR